MKPAWVVPVVVLAAPGLSAQGSEVDERVREVLGLEPREARAFFAEVKRAIVQGDKKAVAKRVAYPITVQLGGPRPLKLKGPAEFEAHYDAIITDQVRQAVRAQAYDELFVNWQGLMVGNGEIWFTARRGRDGTLTPFRIITVNH